MARYSFRLVSNIPAGGAGDQRVQHLVLPIQNLLYANMNVKVNDIGFCEAIFSKRRIRGELNGFFDVAANTTNENHLDFILEVYRQAYSCRLGITDQWRLFGQFLCRYRRDELLNDGRDRFTINSRTPLDLLDRPLVYADPNQAIGVVDNGANTIAAAQAAWTGAPWIPAATDTFTGVAGVADTQEQMMASVVNAATANPAVFTNVTVNPPVAGGGIPDHPISVRNTQLLPLLQELSAASWYAWFYGLEGTVTPVDFDLTPVATGAPDFWSFDVYPGGRGIDRTQATGGANVVVFSPRFNNAVLPVCVFDRRAETTSMLITGQGTDVNREFLRVQNDTRIADSPWNVRERVAGNQNVPAFAPGIREATMIGWRELRDRGMREDFTIVPTNTGTQLLGPHYNLGDLVSIELDGKEGDRQIQGIDVKLFNHRAGKTGTSGSGSQEQVVLELGTLDGRRFSGAESFANIMDVIAERIKEAEEESRDNESAI